ncbi:hydrogenase 3 maturation protease [Citrobacter koseri]|uniref:Hydrogenase 3 maturation protease n=1 Tax=Citrobacter koseri TaxID=545 RepID=A0A447UJS2_CITKO|nr:hydrogenase 3 maturation protease [Citrobacter koseri]
MTDVLLCVGNSMMGDDGAGPLLAEMCAAQPKGNWVVIDGGSAPENDIVAIRELRPGSSADCRCDRHGAESGRDPHHRPG